jgi:acetyl-CoA carboxylase carboxyl transferase alpha subunit/acetyl-CoA carboxylase carboxyl transferase beta subunit
MIEGTQRQTDSLMGNLNGRNDVDTDIIPAVLVKCPKCSQLLYKRDWERNLKVCHHCGYHFRLSAPERIALLLDSGSFREIGMEIQPADPLCFVDRSQAYITKLAEEQKRTGLKEAIVIGSGCIEDLTVALAVMDFRFIGGSMGSVVGEKVTRTIELALEQHIPLLILSVSGGARMHEGILSLLQMAKTTAALTRLSEAHLPFISLLTDPTTGGVTASFGMLGDIILAEPGAFIGFAGPRVIEQFLHQKLPIGAATSEFLLEHGMIDAIIPRCMLRSTIARLLRYYAAKLQLKGVRATISFDLAIKREGFMSWEQAPGNLPCENNHLSSAGKRSRREREDQFVDKPQAEISRWACVQLARHRDRPYSADYIKLMCEDFFELRGDRRYADDRAILGGLASFAGRTVMFIGHQKGRDIRQKQACNFGMPHPEGYRKAHRLMRHAEKFGFPVVCLIDTPGAYPDLESEQRGQAQAIAESLEIMVRLRVPTVAIILGEGGSGGALALGLADRVLMLEHSIYTVAAPEAAASIIWRDSAFAAQAAEAMRIAASDLLQLGIIDGIIREPPEGAHRDPPAAARFVAKQLLQVLAELEDIPVSDLLNQRYAKFRNIGFFSRRGNHQPLRHRPIRCSSSDK